MIHTANMNILATNSSNATLGLRSHGYHFKPSPLDFAVPFTAVSGTLCLFGGVANLFVIVLCTKYTSMNKNMDLYIVSLCLSDFLYNVISQPQIISLQFAMSRTTKFQSAFMHSTTTLFLLVGCFSLFLVSLDKYLFVKYPLRYSIHINKTKTKIIVASIWVICCFIGALRYFNIGGIGTFIPIIIGSVFVLTIIVQVLIFFVAKSHDERITNLNRSLEHNYPGLNENNGTATNNSSSSAVIMPTKATKTIGLMLAVYIMSWLPSTLYRLHYKLAGGDLGVYHRWILILNILIQLHSCANPFIYIIRTKDAKLAIKAMLRKHDLTQFCSCFFEIEGRFSTSQNDVPEAGKTTFTSINSIAENQQEPKIVSLDKQNNQIETKM